MKLSLLVVFLATVCCAGRAAAQCDFRFNIATGNVCAIGDSMTVSIGITNFSECAPTLHYYYVPSIGPKDYFVLLDSVVTLNPGHWIPRGYVSPSDTYVAVRFRPTSPDTPYASGYIVFTMDSFIHYEAIDGQVVMNHSGGRFASNADIVLTPNSSSNFRLSSTRMREQRVTFSSTGADKGLIHVTDESKTRRIDSSTLPGFGILNLLVEADGHFAWSYDTLHIHLLEPQSNDDSDIAIPLKLSALYGHCVTVFSDSSVYAVSPIVDTLVSVRVFNLSDTAVRIVGLNYTSPEPIPWSRVDSDQIWIEIQDSVAEPFHGQQPSVCKIHIKPNIRNILENGRTGFAPAGLNYYPYPSACDGSGSDALPRIDFYGYESLGRDFIAQVVDDTTVMFNEYSTSDTLLKIVADDSAHFSFRIAARSGHTYLIYIYIDTPDTGLIISPLHYVYQRGNALDTESYHIAAFRSQRLSTYTERPRSLQIFWGSEYNSLRIQLDTTSAWQLDLYDVLGRSLLRSQGCSDQANIRLPKLSPGRYIVQIRDAAGSGTASIVVR